MLVLGDGTNLLVRDGGIRGVVINLRGEFRRIRRCAFPAGDPGVCVSAMAGTRLAALCRWSARQGLRGMGFAAGIPGTVGGAIAMNAGTAAGSMQAVIEAVRVLLSPGGRGEVQSATVPIQNLDFGYRRLTWHLDPQVDPPLILGGRFRLTPGNPDQISAAARRAKERRRCTQPLGTPSAGCFFKNPPGRPTAGALVERAGLKGHRVGGAQVSEKHANFIVNRGGASADDLIRLMEQVQRTVAERFGVKLEPEVKIVGSPSQKKEPV
jgi:UDP-N-acetylmuramate dehydrogenase